MSTEQISPKDWMTTVLLCLFVGIYGVHNFYAGKTVKGILQLVTLGGCGIWTIIDMILLLQNKYTDSNGLPIRNSAPKAPAPQQNDSTPNED